MHDKSYYPLVSYCLVPQQVENVNKDHVHGSESDMVDNIDLQISPEIALYTCMTAPIDMKLRDEVLLMDFTVFFLSRN